MKKYKYLLFDLDDTLINNYENVKHAFKVTLKNLKIKYSDEKFMRWLDFERKFWEKRGKEGTELKAPDEFMHSVDMMVKWIRSQRFLIYFNNKISLEKAMELNDIYLEALDEVVIPTDNVDEVLKELSKKYTIIVGTNGPSVATKGKLSKINCLQYVDEIYAADMFGVMKPNAKFFNEIKRKTGDCDSLRYLSIGDSLTNDIQGAKNVGMDGCWFNIKNIKNETDIKPKYEICKLYGLLDILNSKNKFKEQE